MLYHITIPQFVKMLNNLSLILDKAAAYADAKKIDPSVLLNSRLAPDQFPLTRQIQIACDTAKLGASRLTGKEAKVHEDSETTIPQMKARIQDVISYLNTFTAKDFEGSEERKITHPRWDGYLVGSEFATQHALPNLYFHVTTAYAILRHNGLEIGKKDYLGPMPFKK